MLVLCHGLARARLHGLALAHLFCCLQVSSRGSRSRQGRDERSSVETVEFDVEKRRDERRDEEKRGEET